MIERKFVQQKMNEYLIEEFIKSQLKNVGLSHTKMIKTPLGEKVIVYASRPGLVVGRKGENIKQLTKLLKKRFKLENPQIEISEVKDINLDAGIVAERIVTSLERFGTSRFKGVGHKVMTDVMESGALGIEILISGKIPSSRARSWRFYSGYLKKCGDAAIEGVKVAYAIAKLKTGIIGVKVSIMPRDLVLPDSLRLKEKEEIIEEKKEKDEAAMAALKENTKEADAKKKKAKKAPAKRKKKAAKKKANKSEDKQEDGAKN